MLIAHHREEQTIRQTRGLPRHRRAGGARGGAFAQPRPGCAKSEHEGKEQAHHGEEETIYAHVEDLPRDNRVSETC